MAYVHLPVTYVEAQEGDDGQRLDNFLLRTLGAVPRSLVYRILRTGEVRVNGRRAKPAYRLRSLRLRSQAVGKQPSVSAMGTSGFSICRERWVDSPSRQRAYALRSPAMTA